MHEYQGATENTAKPNHLPIAYSKQSLSPLNAQAPICCPSVGLVPHGYVVLEKAYSA